MGGLIGANQSGHIGTCFSMGSVRGETRTGGLVGMDTNGRILDSYWDMGASGVAISSGGSGLSLAALHDPNTPLDAGWMIMGQAITRLCDLWLSLDRDDTAWVTDPGIAPVTPADNVTSAASSLSIDSRALDALWSSPATRTCLHSSLDLLEIVLRVTVTPWVGNAACLPDTCDQPLGKGGGGSVVSYLYTFAVTEANRLKPENHVPGPDAPTARRRGGTDPSNDRSWIDKGLHTENDPIMVQVDSLWSSYCMNSAFGHQRQGENRLSQINGRPLSKLNTLSEVGCLDNLMGLDRFSSMSMHGWDASTSVLDDAMGADGLIHMELSQIINQALENNPVLEDVTESVSLDELSGDPEENDHLDGLNRPSREA